MHGLEVLPSKLNRKIRGFFLGDISYVGGMKCIFTLFIIMASLGWAEPPGWLMVEQTVAAEVAKPQITVVHLWAPWCPNSKAENQDQGWAKFIAANPTV